MLNLFFIDTSLEADDFTLNHYTVLTKEQLDSPLVSDRKMAGFLKVKEFMIILICADAAVFALLFLFHKHELDFGFDLFLVLGALYSIFFDMVCAFAF